MNSSAKLLSKDIVKYLDLPGFKNLEGLPIARSRTAVIETCV